MKDAVLEKMTVKELVDLKRRAEAMISIKQDRERIEVREKIQAMAKEAGFDVADLFVGRSGRTARPKAGNALAKYRHPDNPSWTWSGRGRKPNWINEAGGDIERFRVK